MDILRKNYQRFRKNLRHKGKRKKKETRGKFTVGTSIKNRPK